jgi:hypothetical protein
MPDEVGTEISRSDALSADENPFGDAADDAAAAVVEVEDPEGGFELPGSGRGDHVRPAKPAAVREASSESHGDFRTSAKLAHQISSDSQ